MYVCESTAPEWLRMWEGYSYTVQRLSDAVITDDQNHQSSIMCFGFVIRCYVLIPDFLVVDVGGCAH